MNDVAVLEVGREALWVIPKVASPLLLAALLVGIVIALFQALTSIQEMTLTFVPKIVVIFISLIFFLPSWLPRWCNSASSFSDEYRPSGSRMLQEFLTLNLFAFFLIFAPGWGGVFGASRFRRGLHQRPHAAPVRAGGELRA